MELITARRRNEEKFGYNGSGSISDMEGRGNRSNSIRVAGGLDQMVRKEIYGQVMNFGERDELEMVVDVDKCIDGKYWNEENTGMNIGEIDCQKVISFEEICSGVDRGEIDVGKYGGKY